MARKKTVSSDKAKPDSDKAQITLIKDEVDTFLKKLDIVADTHVSKNNDFFEIQLKPHEESTSGILIGYHGETLSALQLILSLLVSKKIGTFVRLILNVGDYREKREEKLREMALDAAKRAKETKQEVMLGNLAPWQRRIVHMALAEDADVQTESQGEDPERQLIIKPR